MTGWPSLWDAHCCAPLATYPATQRLLAEPHRTDRPCVSGLPYLVLHRMGFADPGRYRRGSALLPATRLVAPPARPSTHGTISTLPPTARSTSLREEILAAPLARNLPDLRSMAVSFCCTDPSPRDARPLAGILPCGARTFLYVASHAATVRPASPARIMDCTPRRGQRR